jgi:(hydroxyamino)benzene mutase
MSDAATMLVKTGFALFTVGLMLGAIISRFRNPRMGLSAHLSAIQGGLALSVFGLAWQYFGIPPSAGVPIAFSLIISTYLLISGLVLAASTGASRALPIAGQGYHATPAMELAVSILTIGSSVWMLLACLAICWFALLR